MREQRHRVANSVGIGIDGIDINGLALVSAGIDINPPFAEGFSGFWTFSWH